MLCHRDIQTQIQALIKAMRENKVRLTYKTLYIPDSNNVFIFHAHNVHIYYTGGEFWEGLETCDNIRRAKWSLPLLCRPSKWSLKCIYFTQITAYVYYIELHYKSGFLYLLRIICHPRITATILCSVWTCFTKRWVVLKIWT